LSTPTLSISIPPGTELPMPTPTIVQSSGQYTYTGCFTEGTGQRALQNASFPDDSNTIALCISQCYPFRYAGAEYGRECWCGDALEGGSSQALDSECTMPCAGDSGEVCGDSVKLSLYE
ncbi:WSC-domain-containing protein, partial [Acephala macrosclerotiorum]